MEEYRSNRVAKITRIPLFASSAWIEPSWRPLSFSSESRWAAKAVSGGSFLESTAGVFVHGTGRVSVLQRSPHGTDRGAPPVFLPTRPITQVHLAALTERVRRRVVRRFRMQQLLDADAAPDMLAWKNDVFSVDASVRIALIDRDVPGYFRRLEHVLRYCARRPLRWHGSP